MVFLSKQLNLDRVKVHGFLGKTAEFRQFEGVKVHGFLVKTAEFR